MSDQSQMECVIQCTNVFIEEKR